MSYRVAILGAGIGAQHLDGYLAHPGTFRVVALCDQDIGRAEAIALRAPGCTPVDTIATILERPDIDIVDICLPPHLHAATAIQALQAGHHVVCEKPLAESVIAGEQMEQSARQAQRILTPIFQYRFGHALSQLRALVRADLTGVPIVGALETHWNRGADYYSVPWRGTWEHERGGAILCHAIHVHDLVMQFFGQVTAVSAMLETRVNPIETEDCGALHFRTASGALVTSSVTLGAADDRSRMRLVFEHLTAESGTNPYAPGQSSWTFSARDAARQAAIDDTIQTVHTAHQGYAGQFEQLALALAGRTSHNVTAADGVAALELVAAAYKSNAERRWVDLPLSRRDRYRDSWLPC